MAMEHVPEMVRHPDYQGKDRVLAKFLGTLLRWLVRNFQDHARRINSLLDRSPTGPPGTMAYQNANAVAITGGSLTGITNLALANGSAITLNGTWRLYVRSSDDTLHLQHLETGNWVEYDVWSKDAL